MEIKHLPCSSGSPRAAGISARLCFNAGSEPRRQRQTQQRASNDRNSGQKSYLAGSAGPDSSARGSRGRPRPCNRQPLPAGLWGRQGSRPSPSHLRQVCLEPELPAEPRYVSHTQGLPSGAGQKAHRPAHGGFTCEGATGRRHEPPAALLQASEHARQQALLTQVLPLGRNLGRRSRRSSTRSARGGTPQEPPNHPARRGTTPAAGGGSRGPRLWLREAAQCVLAAAFQPAGRFGEHTPAPRTHILLMILMKTPQSWSCDRSSRGSVQTFVLFT